MLCRAAFGRPVEPDVNRTIPASPAAWMATSNGCCSVDAARVVQFQWPCGSMSSSAVAWQSASRDIRSTIARQHRYCRPGGEQCKQCRHGLQRVVGAQCDDVPSLDSQCGDTVARRVELTQQVGVAVRVSVAHQAFAVAAALEPLEERLEATTHDVS